jgi:hypothetical protein
MADKVKFNDEDFDNLELVRHIVLRRLREDTTWRYFDMTGDGYERYVAFAQSRLRSRFLVLSHEVLWELMFQGVISPGADSANLTLPFFHITTYGRDVVAAERYIPHDATGYLRELQGLVRSCVGPVAVSYIEYALECFNRGVHVAAVLLLGVAAEAALCDLLAVVRASLRDPNQQRKVTGRPDEIKNQHRWLVAKYEALPASVKRTQLPESLGVTLGSLYELIRLQRNELGHPEAVPPAIGRERAYVYLRLFPPLVADIEAFADYCRANGL